MSATIYLEGGASGADSKDLQIRCREGFRKLLEKCDYKGRMPRLFACGARDAAFDGFKIAVATKGVGDTWPCGSIERIWSLPTRRRATSITNATISAAFCGSSSTILGYRRARSILRMLARRTISAAFDLTKAPRAYQAISAPKSASIFLHEQRKATDPDDGQ